ncbi:MAG: FHA domain-containing protein [Gemmatimonadaceae bacterium]|nr:FHA domain-containing protein [Gemmatimonadaceae bacterium]
MSNEILVAVPGATSVLRFTGTVRVGRAPTNGIIVNHEVVSSEHLELRRTGGGWEVVDLGSTNGTFIDGKSVSRAPLGATTMLQLGPGGPDVRVTIPDFVPSPAATLKVVAQDLIARYFSEDDPDDMSPHTRSMRVAVQEQRARETSGWLKRLRRMRVAVALLVLVAAGAGVTAWVQAKRVETLRLAAGDVFHTIKAIELDMRRLEAETGPNPAIQERRARLEKQYDGLLTTLGIYSDKTPADVQLIYRTVRRLGESEANIPKGFVDEVQKYIARWKKEGAAPLLARASAKEMGPAVAAILLQHHLPREFFYMALQESRLDPRAIGPSTRFGVPKGMWQMIPPTAEAYGLKLGPLQGERAYDPADERHNVTKATNAAARYLEDIYRTDAQASGLLVMASYNMGGTRLVKLIRSMPASPADRNFWALMRTHRKEIPDETYDYVFRVVSAAVIGANPKLFGFDVEPLLGIPSDSIGVVGARTPRQPLPLSMPGWTSSA